MTDDTTPKKKASLLIRIRNNIRKRLIAGILVVVPLWMTYIALKFLLRLVDGFFAPLIDKWFGVSLPGLGLLLLIVLLYLIGTIASNILGRSLIRFGESILDRIPIVKNIYQTMKQLMQTISLSSTLGFKRVILVEYPRKGLRAVAFVTNTIQDRKDGARYVNVFIPTTPNPTSGVFEMVPEQHVIETNLTVEEGIKLVISGGLIVPADFAVSAQEARRES